MKTQARGGLVVAMAALVAGCSLGQSLGAGGASPGPSSPANASGSPVPVPDHNSRYGNNRIGALAAIKVGRELWAQNQYWETYVKTDPVALKGDYDPTRSGSFEQGAAQVTGADLILATESAEAIRTYATGGAEHEKIVLIDVARVLSQSFPAAKSINIQVYYGEGNLHASASYQDGRLDYRAAPR